MGRIRDMAQSARSIDTTSNRPANPHIGQKHYDTTLQQMLNYTIYGWFPVNTLGQPVPPTVTSGSLQSWFDPSVSASVSLSGALITQINDLSGNNRHMYQSTTANQPTYATANKNGLNTMQFSGSQWIRQTTNWTPTDPITFFMVFNATGSTLVTGWTNYRLDLQANTANFGSGEGFQLEGGNIGISWGSNYLTEGWNYTSLVRRSSNNTATAYKNGTQVYNSSAAGGTFNAMGSGVFTAGTRTDNAAPFTGYIGEILLYSGELNSTDLTTVHSYLHNKWGI